MSKIYNINMDDWYNSAVDLKAKGMSNRGIARTLFLNENYRNRLNDFFKNDHVLEDVYKREQELDTLENGIQGHSVSEVYADEAEEVIKAGVFAGARGNDYTGWEKKDKPSLGIVKKKPTILVIADTQAKSEESLEYLLWVGHYIAEKQPDIIVHIGDHYDFPSLSSYDKGKSSSEGRRLSKDIDAGNKGFEYLNMAMESIPDYHPRKVFCLGNHEHRLARYVDDNPELIGTLGIDKLSFEKYGWEVHPFLKPVEIEGIYFVHYLANPFTGKPYAGTAANILSKVGKSFVVGHKQTLDISIRPTIDGSLQLGIVNGACYDFNEGYKGWQGNHHFRGLTVLHECSNGFGTPMFASLDYMKEKYYG